MRVLGIETSCDETGVAVCEDGGRLLAHVLHSQAKLHAAYGGVVPELASRDHVRRLVPLITRALAEAGGDRRPPVDGVAYTAGPGLVGALLTGAAVARGLAYAWDVPAVPVHHLEGHVMATRLEPDAPDPPFLCLLVSGGHTMLVRVDRPGRYELLGQTRDDAAGEAFDKTAKLLGLGYPGGPALAALACAGRPGAHAFPRPMTDRPGLDFSFSGLKTAVRLALPEDAGEQQRADVARGFEDAVVDTLALKCERALRETGLRALIVAGGVGANRSLRARLRADAERLGVTLCYPRAELCTDNGAMIALAGLERLRAGQHDGLALRARSRWPLQELEPLPEEC